MTHCSTGLGSGGVVGTAENVPVVVRQMPQEGLVEHSPPIQQKCAKRQHGCATNYLGVAHRFLGVVTEYLHICVKMSSVQGKG